jgi:hypothetical protein
MQLLDISGEFSDNQSENQKLISDFLGKPSMFDLIKRDEESIFTDDLLQDFSVILQIFKFCSYFLRRNHRTYLLPKTTYRHSKKNPRIFLNARIYEKQRFQIYRSEITASSHSNSFSEENTHEKYIFARMHLLNLVIAYSIFPDCTRVIQKAQGM